MRVFINSEPEIDKNKGVAVALGTFDGFHRGHAALIDELKNIAKAHDLYTLVYTFTSVPSELFTRTKTPSRLFTLEEKIAAFEKTGIDYLILKDFDKKYAAISEDDFIRQLKATLNISYLVVGFNFTYGKGASGNVASLKKQADNYGFQTDTIEPVIVGGMPVSSSRIREALLKGDMETAAVMLGRNYSLYGIVSEGKRFGRSIGFPTINLKTEKEKLLPANGVYITRVWINGSDYPGITNIGYNPTVHCDSAVHVETHILSFEKKIYGERVKLEFLRRIRDEIKFIHTDMLKAQIGKDIQEAERYFKI